MGNRTRFSILSLLSLIIILGTSQQAFAGDPVGGECSTDSDCDDGVSCTVDTCQTGQCSNTPNDASCDDQNVCNGAEICVAGIGCQPPLLPPPPLPECRVGGFMIPLDTTSLVVAGAQMNASWMIPVIVSAIGIGIVIARKF